MSRKLALYNWHQFKKNGGVLWRDSEGIHWQREKYDYFKLDYIIGPMQWIRVNVEVL